MNQILIPESPKNENHLINSHSNGKKFSTHKIYKIQFFIFSFIAIILLIFLFIRIYKQNLNENTVKDLLNIYQISTLYSNDTDYSAQLIGTNKIDSNNTPFVIGMIKIDKINLNYPILSESNKDLLDISLCRFAGPMPNEVGNLCIAGHNYVDYKLFSRLHELEINDTIKIYDLTGQMIEYSVFNKYETNSNDISCTTQDTNGNKIITLLTCNNVTQKRLVVVAKPI